MVSMVVKMPKTKRKPDLSPAVPASALQIPVFEEIRLGHFVFVGYVADESANWIWMKKAA
jgi:hypothetical protein